MSEIKEVETAQWGIVELMGHKVVAGEIQKSEMLGKPMLRVDVPPVGDVPGFTQLYGESAIYCVTFVSEAHARKVAAFSQVKPILVYETRQLQEPVDDDYEPEDE